MISNIYLFIAVSILLLFASLMIFSKKDKNIIYIKYVLLGSPFLSIKLLPSYGYPSVFEFTIICFFIFFYKNKPIEISFLKKYNYINILFFISLFIGVFFLNIFTFDTLYSFIQIICLLLFSKLIIEECYFENNFFNEIIYNLKLLLSLSIVFLILQFIFGPSFTFEKSPNINVLQGNNIRYPSYFQDPQKYAQFLSAGFFICLINFKNKFFFKYGSYFLLVSILVSIFLTGGRAAFIGLLIGLFILFLLVKSNFKFLFLISAFIGFFIINNYSDNFALFNRESTFSESYEFRNMIWNDAIEIFTKYPIFGIGISNYENYVKIYNPDQFWISNNIITYYDHPESGYLKLLVEFGLIGFISFFTLIILPIIYGVKYFIKSKDFTILFLILSLTSWLVGFITVYSLSDNRISIFITTIISLLIVRPYLNERKYL